MKTYLIKEILTECEAGEIRNAKEQFVAVLTAEEWREKRDVFDMGIDIERNPDEIYRDLFGTDFGDPLFYPEKGPDRDSHSEAYAAEDAGGCSIHKTETCDNREEAGPYRA